MGTNRKSTRTEERIDELRDYKLEYGHCRVPAKFESNPSLNEDVGRALCAILPKRKKVNTKPIKIDNGCLKF